MAFPTMNRNTVLVVTMIGVTKSITTPIRIAHRRNKLKPSNGMDSARIFFRSELTTFPLGSCVGAEVKLAMQSVFAKSECLRFASLTRISTYFYLLTPSRCARS